MTLGLNIGLKGIQSSQRALETLGHNISNANTPGYSRQTLDLRASRPLDQVGVIVGTGVDAEGVRRLADDVLNRRLVEQTGVVARYEGMADVLATLESLLAEPGASGAATSFDSFFEAVSALASNPGDAVLRGALVDSAEALTSTFQQLFQGLNGLANDAGSQSQAFSAGVNELAQQVATLNVEIGNLEAGGNAVANDLRDQRDLALIQLASLVEIDVQPKPSGVVHVLVEGQLLVGTSQAYEVTGEVNEAGAPVLRLEGGTKVVEPRGGKLGGIQQFLQEILPGIQQQVEGIVKATILEVNRAHSVGIVASGGYTSLLSSSALGDENPQVLLGRSLADLDLQFPVQEGQLRVNVTKDGTDEVASKVIEIDPKNMSVSDLLEELNGIPNLQVSLDAAGKLSVRATPGHRFDFSSRLDPNPDDLGSFGSGQATVVSANEGPYSFVDGDTLDLSGALGAFTVTLNATDFEDITAVSAEELAEVLNQNGAFIAGQVTAGAVGDQFVLQSLTEGDTATFSILGGSGLGTLGFAAGTTSFGSNTPVAPKLTGAYTGEGNHTWTFRPTGDGTIGSTPDLQVEVLDELGLPVATLNVGEGYAPGSEIAVADGVFVRFDFGQISQSEGDVFQSSVMDDSDTADILVATGMNAFFTGTGAETFSVSEDIRDDPSMIAASGTGASGDNGALLALLELQTKSVESLGGSLSQTYGGMVSEVGTEVAGTQGRLATEQALLQSLEDRRNAVSGVNVDEELVDMIRFEQAFGAAARYINVVQQLGDTLLALL